MNEIVGASPAPKRRGVFHPALLAALYKYIVIELFVAQSVQMVDKAFKDGKVRNVDASHVRGIEDVLIRKYVEDHSWVMNTIPGLSVPHCYLNKADFDAAFETGKEIPQSKFLLEPRKILKFRGKPVPEQTDEQWEALRKEITQTLAGLPDSTKRIISIAKGLADGESIEKQYKQYRAIFKLGEEEIIQTGRESGNRETYLIISIDDHDIGLFHYHIDEELLTDRRIRDIYRIRHVDINPKQNPGTNKFSFLLRLKCDVFDADDLIEELQRWGDKKHVRVGTRSYDLWRHISSDAVEALGDRISPTELRFLRDLFGVNTAVTWVLEPDYRRRFSHAIEQCVIQIQKGRPPEEAKIEQEIREFFYHVCLFNIVKDGPETKRNFSKAARERWLALYAHLENASRVLLGDVLGINPNSGIKNIQKAIGEKINKGQQEEPNLLRFVENYYDDLRAKKEEALQGKNDATFVTKVRQLVVPIRPLRNLAAHNEDAAWEKSTTIDGPGWATQLDELEKKVSAMCELILEMSQEMGRKSLTLAAIDQLL